MVTASVGIKWAGRCPMGELGASPRSQAAVIGSEEAEKDGEVSVGNDEEAQGFSLQKRNTTGLKKKKDERNADAARSVI